MQIQGLRIRPYLLACIRTGHHGGPKQVVDKIFNTKDPADPVYLRV
jgi:hypothetical protein